MVHRRFFWTNPSTANTALPAQLSQFTNIGGLGGNTGSACLPLNDPQSCGPWVNMLPSIPGTTLSTFSWLTPTSPVTGGQTGGPSANVLMFKLPWIAGSPPTWGGSAGAWTLNYTPPVTFSVNFEMQIEGQSFANKRVLLPSYIRPGDPAATANVPEQAMSLTDKIGLSCRAKLGAMAYFGIKPSKADPNPGVPASGVGVVAAEMAPTLRAICTPERLMALSHETFLTREQLALLGKFVAASRAFEPLEPVVEDEKKELTWNDPNEDTASENWHEAEFDKMARPVLRVNTGDRGPLIRITEGAIPLPSNANVRITK
jgi:hypothetical protein